MYIGSRKMKSNLFRKHISIILSLLLCGVFAVAQTQTITGVVLDLETNRPVPFAHCQVEGSPKGFVTDLNGKFNYETSKTSVRVSISSIGYSTRSISLSAAQVNTIFLQADAQLLSEIVFTYVDKERELLQKVKDNISKNYPVETERLTGTIVEQLAKDSSYQDLFYTATSVVEADKLTYANKNIFSTAKILDGEVEYFQPMDSSFTKIYAGIHNLHRFDIIASRMEPFDNINNKSYAFELVDTLIYNDQALFKIWFEASKYQGFLYIQDGTFALIKGEYLGRQEKMKAFSLGRNRLFLKFTTEYFKEADRFRISYINYQTGFAENKKADADKVYLNNFFYLNEAKKVQTLIPFNEQTDYTAIIIDELSPKEATLIDSSKLVVQSNQQREKNILDVLENFSAAYAFGIFDHRFSTNKIQNTSLGIDAAFPTRNRNLMFYQSIGYSFSNTFHLVYYGGASLKRGAISTHSLLTRYTRPITKNRRLLIEVHLGLNYLDTNLKMEENLFSKGGTYQNQTFSPGAINLVEETTQINLVSGLQLKYRIGSRFYLTLSSDIPFSLNNETRIEAQQGEIISELMKSSDTFQRETNYFQTLIGLQMIL